MTEEKSDVCIIGAGLVGAMLAVVLQKTNRFNVTVYERYSDIRTIPSLGRSINLVMTRRGLRAAELLGIKDQMCNDLGVKVIGRVMHQIDNSEVFQKYGREEDCNYSVSRYELNCFLIVEAEKAGAKIYFNHALRKAEGFGKAEEKDENGNITSASIDPSDKIKLIFDCRIPTVPTVNTTSESSYTTETKEILLPPQSPVIGADGAPSKLRYTLRDDAKLCTFTEDILRQGYREMIFPKRGDWKETDVETEGDGDGTGPTKDLGYCMESSGLHIWPRRTHMLMGLADRTGTFTGTIYVDSDSWPKNKEEAVEFFNQYYSSAVPLLGGIDKACEQLLSKPPGILGTVWCNPFNFADGRALLIGDSGHAIVPFFGQGCNSGFEDVVVLDDIIKKRLSSSDSKFKFSDWAPVFQEFHDKRKPSADAIAKLALENFIEMRDKVADKDFLKCKHIEKTLEMRFPKKFRSRYAMVCYGSALHGNISYNNALELGKTILIVVDKILRQVESRLSGPSSESGGPESKDSTKSTTSTTVTEYEYDYVSNPSPAEQEKVVLEIGEELIDLEITPKVKELEMDLGEV